MSTKILLPLLVIVLAGVVAGCGTARDTDKDTEQSNTMEKPANPGPGVPPGHCRVLAEVVSLDECTAAPCSGVIRITEVKGYGSAFNTPLSKGSEVRATFTKSVQGLKVGTSVQADLAHAAMSISGSGDDKPSFTISTFEIR